MHYIASSLKNYLIVFSIALSVFASVVSLSMLLLSYPQMMEFFNISLREFHIRTFLSFCFFSIGLPFFGIMSQKIGARFQFFSGMIIFMIAVSGSALSTSWNIFLFFQSLQATADAMLVSTMSTLIRNNIPSNRLGWAFGFQSAILASAGLIGAPAGNIISFYWGWKSIFYFLFFITLCSYILALTVLPRQPEKIIKRLPLPYLNAFAMLFFFISIHYYINESFFSIKALFFGFLFLFFFLCVEVLGPSHLIPKEAFRNTPFLICVFFIFCITTVSHLIFFFTPTYLQGYLKFSSTNLSWIIAIGALIPLIFSTYFGKLSDRFPHQIFVAGTFFYFLILFLYSFLYTNLNWWILGGIYTTIGLANALLSPSHMKIAIMTIPESLTGPYMGAYYFAQFCSGSVATMIFMLCTSGDNKVRVMAPNEFYSIISFCVITMFVLLFLGIARLKMHSKLIL